MSSDDSCKPSCNGYFHFQLLNLHCLIHAPFCVLSLYITVTPVLSTCLIQNSYLQSTPNQKTVWRQSNQLHIIVTSWSVRSYPARPWPELYILLTGYEHRNTHPKMFAGPVVLKICSTFIMLIVVFLQALENHVIFLYQ